MELKATKMRKEQTPRK